MTKFTIIFLILFFAVIFSANSQAANLLQTSGDDTIYKSSEVDKDVKLTKKPHPHLGGRIQECRSSGKSRIRIVLRKTGRITDVELLASSSCNLWDEASLEAAGKIKFQPAMKNGQAVSVSKIIEYEFFY
jgi:TonB family protein